MALWKTQLSIQVPSPFISFYGLLPSKPGNSPGLLHRDTYPLEASDIDGRVSATFKKPYYLTVITPLGKDEGSTGFYLGSHKLTSSEVKEAGLDLVCPVLEAGSIKVFDGRIGHQGMPIPGEISMRKALFSVHHSPHYRENDLKAWDENPLQPRSRL